MSSSALKLSWSVLAEKMAAMYNYFVLSVQETVKISCFSILALANDISEKVIETFLATFPVLSGLFS